MAPGRNNRFCILNPNAGNGPYLRLINLIFSLNKILRAQNKTPYTAIVPLIYKNRQISIIKEEFIEHLRNFPDDLVLDEQFGELLGSILYDGKSYQKYLQNLVDSQQIIQQKINAHFSQEFSVTRLDGTTYTVNKIDLTISRNPIVKIPAPISIYTSIAFFSDILEQGKKHDLLDHQLANKVLSIARTLEQGHNDYFVAHPCTFSYDAQLMSTVVARATIVPPIGAVITKNTDKIVQGIYITASGIPHLSAANITGTKIYSSKELPNATRAPPQIISNKNIIAHVARAGWSSIWSSWLTKTPLLAMPFEADDDIEIFFNLKTIEQLNLGIIYDSTIPLQTQIEKAQLLIPKQESLQKELLKKYGTLDGNFYVAQKISVLCDLKLHM